MKTLNLEGRQETGVGRRRKGRGVLEKREGEYRGGTVAFSCTLLPPHLQLPRPSPSLVSSPLFPSLTLFLTTFLDILVNVLPSPFLVFLQLMQKRKWTRKTSTAKNHPAERDQLGEALQGFFIVQCTTSVAEPVGAQVFKLEPEEPITFFLSEAGADFFGSAPAPFLAIKKLNDFKMFIFHSILYIHMFV